LLLAKLTLSLALCGLSVEHAALISRHHILDVDEGVFATVLLKHFESSLDQVTKVHLLPLTVHDGVSDVLVVLLEQVEDGEDLTVVGDECLTDGLRAQDERLEDLEGDHDNLGVAGVESSYEKRGVIVN